MRIYTKRSLEDQIHCNYAQVISELNDRAGRLVLNPDNSTSTLHLEQPNSAWSTMTCYSNASLLGLFLIRSFLTASEMPNVRMQHDLSPRVYK